MKAEDVIAWLRREEVLESGVKDGGWRWTDCHTVRRYLAYNAGDIRRKIIYKVIGTGDELEISLYVNQNDEKVPAFKVAAQRLDQVNFVEWFENKREAGVKVRQRILCNRLPDFLSDSIRTKLDQLYLTFGPILNA